MKNNPITIVNYKDEYAADLSNIITRNLLEINSRDYSFEEIQKHILSFTSAKIREYSKQRTIFVALIDGQE